MSESGSGAILRWGRCTAASCRGELLQGRGCAKILRKIQKISLRFQISNYICSVKQNERRKQAMTLKEFTDRTNFYPTQVQWEQINEEYMNCTDDKDTFCRKWRKENMLEKSRENAFYIDEMQGDKVELAQHASEVRKAMLQIGIILNIAQNDKNQEVIREFYNAYNSFMKKIDEITK
jgi:hypothetical protein